MALKEMLPVGKSLLAVADERDTTMAIVPQVIEITAGEVAAELKRRGIGSDERVTLTIEPAQELP